MDALAPRQYDLLTKKGGDLCLRAFGFWIIYVLCVIFGLWSEWPSDGNYRPLGGRFVVFVLLGLLGWGLFGPPIK